jgi:tRNA (guanine-N7-)-methyltransferase
VGRRSLPKVDPLIDLSRHYRDLRKLEPPFRMADFFASEGPLEVELGTGKGLFLQAASKASPDRRFIGLELADKYSRYSAYRLARDGAENAVMISGDGLRFFREFLPTACCQAVHVYFPDPWWKKRHAKRRVMNGPFLEDVVRTLVPGGSLHFWSDVEEYFRVSLELLKLFPQLEGPLPVEAAVPAHEFDYRTHFERRMTQHDKPIFRSRFIRSDEPFSPAWYAGRDYDFEEERFDKEAWQLAKNERAETQDAAADQAPGA